VFEVLALGSEADPKAPSSVSWGLRGGARTCARHDHVQHVVPIAPRIHLVCTSYTMATCSVCTDKRTYIYIYLYVIKYIHIIGLIRWRMGGGACACARHDHVQHIVLIAFRIHLVWRCAFRLQISAFKVQGLRFKVQGLGFRVWS